ncbi:uncharacterized protein [Venturia canescens]|uniref:uncharacterized protein n=1 Tax=Venturia canescens TaxID=32260 RepID=UPI001C9C7C97|nr:uncharacterized protein LOC122407133 [Venturia canescens]
MFRLESADDLILQEIDRIVRERWRIIERTTRYGWLISCYQGSSISREEATLLSSLAIKIGHENCKRASDEIRKACHDVHPHCVPKIAIAILDEMYTVVIFRKRGRESKWQNILLRDSPPTVFTISNAIF